METETFPFTYNKDVDIEILSCVNNNILKALCLSNKYALSLCNNNILWSNKLLKLYPDFPVHAIKSIHYKQIYDILLQKDIFKNHLIKLWAWNSSVEKNKDVYKWINIKFTGSGSFYQKLRYTHNV